MNRALDHVARACILVSGISLLGMTAAISFQVIARYVFNDSPAWSERLSLVLLAYLVFFGAAAGVRNGVHIRISALEDRLPERARWIVSALGHGAVVLAGILIATAGSQIALRLWSYPIPALGWPRGIALLPVPVSGVLMALFAGHHVLRVLKERSA